MAPPRHQPLEIDLDDDDDESGSSTSQTENTPYLLRRSFPSIPTASQTRKRNATALDLDSAPSSSSEPERPQAGPSVKRLKRPGERVNKPPKTTSHNPAGGTSTPTAIEAIDLTEEATPLKDALQKQREDQIKAQREDAGKPLLLTKMTCVVCMDSPTDLTATKCGHLYCHVCLNESLKAGEVRRRQPGEQQRIPQCPVCRTRLDRRKDGDVIPLLFMRKKKARS
ncbi:putative c3hc4 type (ring finger) zinc finger containing protein [Venturia nashicola]|uniref:Putative c3hc4 type (Ring finger) zinc finger containing protein n=1 Tax=Venturia nashicola TaxID=86259 RepID=A0A4Z1NRB9_9PEZI|nr:putative c3hc4 type (ring finger) zinc finger containing protein [Venturia nashicola]